MKIKVNNISFCAKSNPVVCLEEYNKQTFLKTRQPCLEETDISDYMILEKDRNIFYQILAIFSVSNSSFFL